MQVQHFYGYCCPIFTIVISPIRAGRFYCVRYVCAGAFLSSLHTSVFIASVISPSYSARRQNHRNLCTQALMGIIIKPNTHLAYCTRRAARYLRAMSDPTTEELSLEPDDSPCVLICSMERESGLCFGCGRSSDEIAYWTLKSSEERADILKELPARLPPLRVILEQRRAKRRVTKRGSRGRTPSLPTPPEPKDS